ncbi:MAG: HAD family hydrolase [Bacilli bacterium]|nr:HAD family hydrolase [Bacilli bacterium]
MPFQPLDKLVVLDLDGTLLDDSFHIPSRSVAYLKTLKEKGFDLVLSSGRPYRAMREYYDLLELKTPIITHNGAYTFIPGDDSFPPQEFKFPKDEVKRIIKESKEHFFSCIVESENNIYLAKDDPFIEQYFPYKKTKHFIGDIENILDEDVFTLVFGYKENMADLIGKSIEKNPKLKCRRWTGVPYEEGHINGVTKGSSLAHIIRHLGYKKENIIAIGDSDNDYEMLSLSGISFTMKNTRSETMKNSFLMAEDDNNHEGVRKTLERIIGK